MQMKEKICLTGLLLGTNVHHYEPKSKCASMQWKHPSSPSAKKFKVLTLAGMVMLSMFWDPQGVLLVNFQKHGENVNFALYCELLFELRNAICRKRPGLLERGLLLHHVNARPHTARETQERIQELQRELLQNPP
jgi:histone-lysine N-methyltransferase SETMAR